MKLLELNIVTKTIIIMFMLFISYFVIRFGQLDFWYKTISDKLDKYPNVEWKTENDFLSFTTYVNSQGKDICGEMNINGENIPIEISFLVTNRKTHKNITVCYRKTDKGYVESKDRFFKGEMNLKKEKLVISEIEYYNGINGPVEIILYK